MIQNSTVICIIKNTGQSGSGLRNVGHLALERLNYTPLGYVRGELVYSLPLTPGEVVRVTHREWSRTEEEFVKLVQTSDEMSERDALSEKSELAESSRAQQQHSSALNASASVSGGFGSVRFSSSVGYNAADAVSASQESSAASSGAPGLVLAGQRIEAEASTAATENPIRSIRAAKSVSPDAVQAELIKESPNSAAFLATVRFFRQPGHIEQNALREAARIMVPF